MKFEFAKYTEITDYAFGVNPEYKNAGYVRLFICPDVFDFWLVRILEGVNEEYEKEEGSYVLERNQIPMNTKGQKLTILKLRDILENDDFGNYDLIQGFDLEKLIDDNLDDGFGIINRKEIVTNE